MAKTKTGPPLTDEQKLERAKTNKIVRAAKFVELTEKRMTGVLKALGRLRNLGAYPHTEEQRVAIVSALETAVDGVSAALELKTGVVSNGFRLS